MNAELLQMISVVSYILAVIFLLVAILLFFLLDIRSVIDDLSGKKEKRQIQELRAQNKQTEVNRNGQILYEVAAEKRRVTSDLEQTHKLYQQQDTEQTVLLKENEEATTLLTGNTTAEEQTTLLQATEETTLLTVQKTELINDYYVLLDELIIHTKERISL